METKSIWLNLHQYASQSFPKPVPAISDKTPSMLICITELNDIDILRFSFDSLLEQTYKNFEVRILFGGVSLVSRIFFVFFGNLLNFLK